MANSTTKYYDEYLFDDWTYWSNGCSVSYCSIGKFIDFHIPPHPFWSAFNSRFKNTIKKKLPNLFDRVTFRHNCRCVFLPWLVFYLQALLFYCRKQRGKNYLKPWMMHGICSVIWWNQLPVGNPCGMIIIWWSRNRRFDSGEIVDFMVEKSSIWWSILHLLHYQGEIVDIGKENSIVKILWSFYMRINESYSEKFAKFILIVERSLLHAIWWISVNIQRWRPW